jgi:site-specific recombinase XerC
MASLRKRGKLWYYRFVNENGAKVERKGCADKRVTEELARAVESAVARTRAGLSDPKAERMAREARRPIWEHAAEFVADVEARGNDPEYVELVRRHLDRIIALTRAERIADLTPSVVMQAVGALKADGLSAWTLNHAVSAAKAFSKWLRRDGRAADYTLETLTKFNVQADRRHVRRALTLEEALCTIQAAESGPTAWNLTGPDRAVLYLTAMGTGFRARELRTLLPESFDLDGDPPTVTVKAAFSKRRRDDVQVLPSTLADRLRPWLARRAPREPLFGRLTKRTAEMLRRDLEAAGVPHETPEGVADFHALRVAYITHLVNSGASVKTCQTLARHSTPSLTIGIYARTTLHDIAGAVENLPDLTPRRETAAEPLAATGTDGSSISNHLAHHLPTGEDGSVRPGTAQCVMTGSYVH